MVLVTMAKWIHDMIDWIWYEIDANEWRKPSTNEAVIVEEKQLWKKWILGQVVLLIKRRNETRSATAVDLRCLKVKEQDISLTNIVASLSALSIKKISLIYLLILKIQQILGVSWTKRSCPFFTMSNQKIFDQLLIFVNFYQHAKKKAASSIWFWRDTWFKNPAIWLAERTLASISRTKFFQNNQDLTKNTANNIN